MVAGGIHTAIKGALRTVYPFATHQLTSRHRQVLPCRVRYVHLHTRLSEALTIVSNRHMGVSVVDTERGDIDRISKALAETLKEASASRL